MAEYGPKILSRRDNVLILETKEGFEPKELMEKLGGTIKIGRIAESGYGAEDIAKLIMDNISDHEGKSYFGISFYDNSLYKKHKNLGAEVKKYFKEQGVSVRWVVSRDKALSSVVVKKNKLVSDRGAEICLLPGAIGITQAIQEFEDYSRRDYGRPARDSRSGMIPPKLAKMMINLAGQKYDKKLLDPFCGSGTILAEALLMGYEDVMGSDKSEKAVSDSEANLDWLGKEAEVFNVDVRSLSKRIEANSIDAIITEPYLGPPLRCGEKESEIRKNINELESLYAASFQEFKKVLKEGGKVVIIFPVFKYNGKEINLNMMGSVRKIGFERLNKERLLYARPDQRVMREIIIFVK